MEGSQSDEVEGTAMQGCMQTIVDSMDPWFVIIGVKGGNSTLNADIPKAFTSIIGVMGFNRCGTLQHSILGPYRLAHLPSPRSVNTLLTIQLFSTIDT